MKKQVWYNHDTKEFHNVDKYEDLLLEEVKTDSNGNDLTYELIAQKAVIEMNDRRYELMRMIKESTLDTKTIMEYLRSLKQ